MKELQRQVSDRYKVSPYLVLFLISSIQIGVGVLGFQSNVVNIAGNDSWIAVILAGLLIHILIWIIYKILKYGNGDLITIHYDVFGKWLGGVFSFVWILYFIGIGVVVLRTFLQVVQVWMFSDINMFWVTSVYLILIYYLVSGGFRVVTGVAFLGIVIPSYLILSLIYTLEYTNFNHLLPVWNHSYRDILSASQTMTFSFIGFSALLIFYPYIKEPEKSKVWGHAGNLYSFILYLIIILITIAYFTEGHLVRHYWPTLTMWKTVEMPFVERFEYIGISSWGLIILPNVCLAFWAASRGIRQLFRFSQRKGLILILLLTLGANMFISSHDQLVTFNEYFSQIGFYLITCYLPFLLLMTYFRIGRKKKS
ncbi:GerAB/ArcD/ProY family transporter [Aquisalibacillus elongatus]|uniref:Spore germination protein (Amino acid permease) n=1 Tax=Aquisalibacillus elongatus TaxID=485577 RepID=A0A3N5B4F3_9BACI|nr:GerAB/ArcD/ProY family transporter [Aquisalibacillus elongatus]RPF52147.1 spore germination protein (amino acid permease) [Aquisalibacillus elongatus]